MDLKTALARAKRGIREDLRLYLVAVSSLSVAFLCLSGALLGLGNLSQIADRWGQSRRMTVYLVDGARSDDVAQLRLLVEGLPEVASVEHVSSSAARERFLEEADLQGDLGALTPDVFPASLEVVLGAEVTAPRMAEMGEKIRQFGAVDEVQTYGGWFSQLDSLLGAGRALAGIIALLVGACVLAVIGNTIRLAIAARREEIEVMKMCGASDSFVRSPFVVEGALQSLVAASTSLILLGIGFLLLRSKLDATLLVLSGSDTVFLDPLVVVGLLVGSVVIGAAGSALSLRRYLAV